MVLSICKNTLKLGNIYNFVDEKILIEINYYLLFIIYHLSIIIY